MKKSTLILFLAAFALAACKKDQIDIPSKPVDIENPTDNVGCIPLEEQFAGDFSMALMFDQIFFETEYPIVQYIDLNPNYPDEILITYFDFLATRRKLARYNLKTKEKKILLESGLNGAPVLATRPRWSTNGWIIFDGQPGTIPAWDAYKIKDSGDSLTRLTFQGNIHRPEWNWKGDKFYCGFGMNTNMLIFDEHGNIMDTVTVGAGLSTWKHPAGLKAGHQNAKTFRVVHPEKDSLVFNMALPHEYSGGNGNTFNGGAEWLDEENIIWSCVGGVFRTNYNTGQTKQLISSCDAILYSNPAYSSAIKKVIFLRRTYAFPDGTTPGVGEVVIVSVDPFDGTMEVIAIDGL
jgi:hypothetical protein